MGRFVTRSRSRRALAIGAALIFSASISPAFAQAPVSQLWMSALNIVHFVPSAPTNDTRGGFCWTSSIAAPARHDAYRCTVDNGIHDPCFILPPNHDRLVCDADPALKKNGFLLKLTKSLSKTSHLARSKEPWLLKLADGSNCEAMTGTMPAGYCAAWL